MASTSSYEMRPSVSWTRQRTHTTISSPSHPLSPLIRDAPLGELDRPGEQHYDSFASQRRSEPKQRLVFHVRVYAQEQNDRTIALVAGGAEQGALSTPAGVRILHRFLQRLACEGGQRPKRRPWEYLRDQQGRFQPRSPWRSGQDKDQPRQEQESYSQRDSS